MPVASLPRVDDTKANDAVDTPLVAPHVKRTHQEPNFVTQDRDQPPKKPRFDEAADVTGSQPPIPGRYPSPSVTGSTVSRTDSGIGTGTKDASKADETSAGGIAGAGAPYAAQTPAAQNTDALAASKADRAPAGGIAGTTSNTAPYAPASNPYGQDAGALPAQNIDTRAASKADSTPAGGIAGTTATTAPYAFASKSYGQAAGASPAPNTGALASSKADRAPASPYAQTGGGVEL